MVPINIYSLKSLANWLTDLIQSDRRNPPVGSNHELANEMTHVLVGVGAVTAVVLSIAGLLMSEPVSTISVGFAVFVAACLLL